MVKKQDAHDKINKAVEESVVPSPDSARTIATRTGEEVTLVARVMSKKWVRRGGRWVRREDEEQDA